MHHTDLGIDTCFQTSKQRPREGKWLLPQLTGAHLDSQGFGQQRLKITASCRRGAGGLAASAALAPGSVPASGEACLRRLSESLTRTRAQWKQENNGNGQGSPAGEGIDHVLKKKHTQEPRKKKLSQCTSWLS